jgi:response regulator RpfG family c-di-GMP phosphodiesterase
MLTATYSLVAIAAEQDKTRSLLHRVQHFVEASWKGLQSIDFGFLEAGYTRLLQFDHYLRNRKIELYLMPALRGVSREGDLLLAELESLSAKAGRVLQEAASQLDTRMELSRIQVSQMCDSMQTYCRHVAACLQLEEQSLLPLARRLLSMEDWFRLASEFLSRDGGGDSRRTHGLHARGAARIGSMSDLH